MLLVLTSAAAVCAIYWPTLHYIFLSDDTVYITENSRLAGLHYSELWRLFIEPYNRYSEFLPLRDLSYWFDMHLSGLDPAAFRMHNIILHLLCLPLVYATTQSLWRYFRPADTDAAWAAAAVTAMFALHPALVESVVWISGRKYVLPNLFAMLALWLAIRARRPTGLSVPHAAGALLAVAATMLSKASYVTVAPIIALLWLMFWRDVPSPAKRNSQLVWPFSILMLAMLLVLVFIGSSEDRGALYPGMEAVSRALAVLGWLARLAVSPESRHFFYPVLEDPYLPVMIGLGIAVAIAAVTAMVMLMRKRSIEGFAIVAFFLLCIPYIQLIPYVPPSLVSDRFLALAAWPAVLLIVALAWRLNPVSRTVLLIVFALSWSFTTVARPREWHSLEALLDADIRTYPGFYIPAAHKIIYVQLKKGLRRDAMETANSIQYPEARVAMIELIRADYAVRDIAVATGNPEEAISLLGKLEQKIRPPVQAQWNSALWNFWSTVGIAVINEWEYLAQQFPDAPSVRYDAGLWLLKVHKYKEAIVHLRAAAESPGLPEAVRGTADRNLGVALLGAGNVAAAEAPLRAALEQRPPDFRAYCSLAGVYKHSGRFEEAARAEAECHNRAPE